MKSKNKGTVRHKWALQKLELYIQTIDPDTMTPKVARFSDIQTQFCIHELCCKRPVPFSVPSHKFAAFHVLQNRATDNMRTLSKQLQ